MRCPFAPPPLPPMSEPEQLKALVDINVDFVSQSPYPSLRSEHGKGVADLRAEFTVLDSIAPDLAQGLFAAPGRFEAIIRFSNGAQMDDSKRDSHGMAVKVLGVPMETAPMGEDGRRFQDFIMIDVPVFVIGDLRDYIPFNDAFLAAKVSLMGKLRLAGIVLCNLRWVPTVLRLALNKANAPLSPRYFSTTPYALGPTHAVKYKAVPIGRSGIPPRISGPDGRRAALRRQLEKGPGLFTFGVIVQTDRARQPIDEPSVDWEEQGARFHPLAEIRIPSDQLVEAPPDLENGLSFSPGHAAAEHAPLGAINRARVAIYSAARKARLAALRRGH